MSRKGGGVGGVSRKGGGVGGVFRKGLGLEECLGRRGGVT